MNSDADRVIVTTEHADLVFDAVVDARGFPPATDGHVTFSAIPTSAALLTRGPPSWPRDRTRAVARSDGWTFVIPLGSETAYGYVHGGSDRASAHVDFEDFLSAEGVTERLPIRSLTFPNFRRTTPFGDRVFSVGNRAGFIEPLEATALGMTVLQLNLATLAILDRALGRSDVPMDAINHELTRTMDEGAAFVAWHYARGSSHPTSFWTDAARRFATWERSVASDQRDRFRSFARRGEALPPRLALANTIDEVDRAIEGTCPKFDTFGGFLDVSFAKVGHGIGWYQSPPSSRPEREREPGAGIEPATT